ncbi:LPXTG cell wall anchor domain-containing protein [Brevibacterium sp. LE-L]|uniref:LPXTG cell wall anchor domain-containing protein n=1 Tax=Brevibacterium sp. LE-L TaxID=3418557 RepID=UPI003CF6CE82
MKKLALAPAVAIAITGLAASPVIAAPEAPTSTTQQPAQATQLQKASGAKAQDGEEAGVNVSESEISLADFVAEGVDIVGADLNPNTEYSVVVSHTNDQVGSYEETLTTDDTGAFATGVKGLDDEAFIGKYSVVANNATNSNESHHTTFEVTDEPEAPAADQKVSLSTDKISESDFAKNGIKVTGEGFTPDGKVTVVGGTAQSPFATVEVDADEEGKISATLKFDGDDNLPAGDYSVWGVDQETETSSDAQTFTITEDETDEPTTPAAEAKLAVSPETISPADFVKEDKGVTLAVENCEPGEDIRFLVNPKGESNVTAFDKTVKADDEGKASVNVYGTSASNASAYIGDYDVTVTCGDDELTGEFSVSDDANAGGSDGGEDGNDDGDNGDAGNGGDLPRTGTELTGLVGGAGLLLIGGVAVALTMRRKKVAQDPAEI